MTFECERCGDIAVSEDDHVCDPPRNSARFSETLPGFQEPSNIIQFPGVQTAKPKKVKAVKAELPLFSATNEGKKHDVVSGSVTWIAPGSLGVSNWRAGRLVDGDGETVKFAGSCLVKVGDAVRLHGEWVDDDRFGRQIKVAFATAAIGRNYDSIRRLFETDPSFRQIGPKRAQYIAEFLKDRNLDLEDVLESDELLEDLRVKAKLPEEAVEYLVISWAEKREENIAKADMISLGVPTKTLETIWRAHGRFAIDTIRDNPYSLTETVDGFGLADADKIAKSLKISDSDPRRLVCGVLSTMRREVVGNGHTWITKRKLGALTVNSLQIGRAGDHKKMADTLEGLLSQGRIRSTELSGIDGEIVCDPWLLGHEQKFTQTFGPAAKEEPNPHFVRNPLDPEWVKRAAGAFTPSEKQIEAVEVFSKRRLTALTGAAGTGKTATVTMLLRVCEERSLIVALAAPTGKAAMRLLEMIGKAKLASSPPALTIHKLLGYQGEKWLYNEKNKLPIDVLIVDEMSMTDIPLMSKLIDALKPTTALVLVGDHNQLPPVGPGAAFRDVIESELCNVVRLNTVFRQAGALRKNATEVLRGVMTPTTVENGVETWRVEDWHKDPQQAHDSIVEHYRTRLTELGERGLLELQVLSPMYDGVVGINALNKSLRPVAHEILYGETFDPEKVATSTGDKVIQTKNDYQVGVMNGDQGVVKSVAGFQNNETGRWDAGWVVEIQRGDKRELVNVPLARTEGFMLAYAISVHRFQGSEAEHVIGAAHSIHKHMLNRPLIYTISTRASRTLTLVGDREGLYEGAKRDNTAHRRTLSAPPWLVKKLSQDPSA